jgi:carnitine monooxygenase subunit
VPGFHLAEHRLQPCRVEEFHGLVFVNLDNDVPTLAQAMPGLADRLAEYAPDLPQLTFVHRTQADLRSNWKIAVENYSECYHCEIVHKSFFGEGKVSAASYRIELHGHWHEHLAESGYQPTGEEGSDHAAEFGAWWMWPNFAIQSHPGYLVNVRQWVPLAVDHTRVTVDWFLPQGAMNEAYREQFLEHAATVFQEDIPLVESVQQGVSSRAYRPGPLMIDEGSTGMSEHAVGAIQALWREAMGPNL